MRAPIIRRPTVVQLLRTESARLDTLIAEFDIGPRDQSQFDALEECGQGIASGIRAAFRGKRA